MTYKIMFKLSIWFFGFTGITLALSHSQSHELALNISLIAVTLLMMATFGYLGRAQDLQKLANDLWQLQLLENDFFLKKPEYDFRAKYL